MIRLHVSCPQQRKAGERDFGPRAAPDYDGTVLDWMDRHLKGVDTAAALDAIHGRAIL
jgi:hypothetical protein